MKINPEKAAALMKEFGVTTLPEVKEKLRELTRTALGQSFFGDLKVDRIFEIVTDNGDTIHIGMDVQRGKARLRISGGHVTPLKLCEELAGKIRTTRETLAGPVSQSKPVNLAHNRAVTITTKSGDVLTILPGEGMKRAPIRLKGAARISHKALTKRKETT